MRDITKVKKSTEASAVRANSNTVKNPATQNQAGAQILRAVMRSRFLPWVLTLLLLMAGVAGTLYFKKQADDVKSDPVSVQQEKNQAETDRVLSALKKVFFIGEIEAPTVARIEDPEKLKSSNATFYKDVLQGDYLVIYPKRAIIFRESANQVINTAPIINSNDLQSGEGTTPAATEPLPSAQPSTESR